MPTATLLYGALHVLLFVGLSINVSRLRLAHGVFVGEGTIGPLSRAVRAHGNYSQSVGLALVMLLACELAGATPLSAHLLGGGFLLARVLHAAGMLGKNRLQSIGAMLSLAVLLAEGGYALWLRH